MKIKSSLLFVLLILGIIDLDAQTGVGVYANGSFDIKSFDTVNQGNLNIHFSIPLVSKPGRGGADFTYNLIYDSLIWSIESPSGSPVWNPALNFGWQKGETIPFAGLLYFTQSTVSCGSYNSDYSENYTYEPYNYNYVYYDKNGAAHSFAGYTGGCSDTSDPSNTPYSYALDSSADGIVINGDNTVTLPSGIRLSPQVNFTPSLNQITTSDINGNQITWNSGVYTDTTGVNILSISDGSYSYPTVTGTATVNTSYATYTVQTNFACSGVGEYGPMITRLVDRITLPDGSYYGFTYETTPGASNAVTGRISAVHLPTGGTISYAYSGSLSGACSNGMNANGIPGKLVRTMDGGQTSYDTTVAPSVTRVTRPSSDVTDLTFIQATDGLFYETHRKVYTGSAQGVPLLDIATCYNNASANCDAQSLIAPITKISTVTTSDGIATNGTDISFDSDGNNLQTDIFDYGTNGDRGMLLQSTIQTFAKFGYGMQQITRTTDSKVQDGSGNQVSHIHFGFDEASLLPTSGLPHHIAYTGTRGTPSSIVVAASPSPTETTTFIYDDAGSLRSASTMSGTTSYGYDSTDTFITSTSLPTPSSGVALATSSMYDTNTGALTSTTDMNGQQILYKNFDVFGRATEIDFPDGGRTVNQFWNQNGYSIWSYQTPSKYTDNGFLIDDFGRSHRQVISNDQSANQWNQQDTCYDSSGRINVVSYGYQGNAWSTPKVCSGAGDSFTYDALGRIKTVIHGDSPSTSINYTYAGKATKSVDENGITRITEIDGLGRTAKVCEISSNSSMPGSGGPTSCATDIGGTGFATTYSYDLANHKTTVTQGLQSRIYQSDSIGRPILSQEPESGITSYAYSYNSNGLQTSRVKPRANQSDPNVHTTTTTQVDTLGRVISINYDDGTPSKSFVYDGAVYWTNFNQANVKGRLSSATGNTGYGPYAQTYSYDAMGRVVGLDTCMPSGCGNPAYDRVSNSSYDWEGNLLTIGDGAGVTAFYAYSRTNEAVSLTSSANDSTHPPALVSNVQRGPFGTVGYQLGNGLNVASTYDALGRLNGSWLCNGSNQSLCLGGAQVYGMSNQYHGTRVITADDTALNEHRAFSYDEFNRLSGTNIGYGQRTFSYVYDRYGNRWQQNAPQGGPAPSLTFNSANNQASGYGYDAAGNLTNDGFHSYSFDADGNVVTVDNGSTARYSYSASNQRIRIDQSGSSVEFVFNLNGQRASIWDAPTHTQLRGQYYWDGMPIAYYTAATHFQHQDWLGTARLQTGYSGVVEASYYSLPFGDSFSGSGSNVYGGGSSNDEAYHFSMLDHDYGSFTDHAQFRQYSPAQGRWMSPDPYSGSYDATNPQSLNRYSYALNTPTSAVDPLGLDTISLWTYVDVNAGGFDYGLPIPFIGFQNFPFYVNQLTGNAPRINSSAPSKTGCTAQRIYSGLMGAANLGLAVGKGFALGGAVAGIGATGVGAPAAAVLGVYGTVSIFGQGLAGTAQLYSAVTGNYGAPAKVAQIGNILAGPVSGLGTLLRGGSMSSAETNAGYESLATAASSVIDAINAGAKGLGIAMSDYHTGAIGYIGGDGSAFCGGH